MKVPAVIRNGWWVAAAIVPVAVFTVVLVLARHGDAGGEARNVGRFDLTTAVVEAELIVRGMPTDGVRSLLDPRSISPAEIDRFNEEERGKLLVPTDRVIGIAAGGESRAYPLRVLRWHEVVNDHVGGEPIVVTYNPLCDSVTVFSTERELGVSGLLYNSNTLLYDRKSGAESSPLWTQLDGRPVAGPDPSGAPHLKPRPAELVTWEDWLARHPATTVIAQEPDLKKLYKRDPYHSYFGSDTLRFNVAPLPPETGLRLKDRVVVLTVDGDDAVFPIPVMAQAVGSEVGTLEIEVGDVPFSIRFDNTLGVARVEALAEPERLQAVRYAFWFAWFSHKRTIPDIIRTAS